MADGWSLLRCRTAGLSGGVNLEQPFDFTGACRVCGAGARPIPPLRADLARMGKKRIDVTAHEGLLIAERSFVEALAGQGLTGFRIVPVSGRSPRALHDRYCWLEIVASWPPLHPDSKIQIEDLCPLCRRSGHFDVHPTGTRLVYAAAPPNATDFGLTWEYFGRWRPPKGAARSAVGGSRFVIVSTRARQRLSSYRLRHVTFDPIVVMGPR